MTNERGDQERLSALLAELVDGKLSEQQIDELRNLMSHDDLARQLYFQHLVTHAMLEWRHGTSSLPAPTNVATTEVVTVAQTPTADGESQLPTSLPSQTSIAPPTFGFLGGFTGSFAIYPVAFLLVLLVVGAVYQSLSGNCAPHRNRTTSKASPKRGAPAALSQTQRTNRSPN